MTQEDDIKLKFSLVKTAASLANIAAKISFLSICVVLGAIPTGILLKFSLQTGLPNDASKEVDASIRAVLSKASIDLLKITKDAEVTKSNLLNSKLLDIFAKIDDKQSASDLATAKFKRILILRTRIHSGKLKKLLHHQPPAILDLEEETSNFTSKFSIPDELLPPSPQENIDWFEMDFPPLPPPAAIPQLDWTEELNASPSSYNLSINPNCLQLIWI